MSCLLAKSDAASLTQAFCRGPIKHRVSGARSAALDCATSLSIAQAPVGNVHALGWAAGGKELVSILGPSGHRARTSHMLA